MDTQVLQAVLKGKKVHDRVTNKTCVIIIINIYIALFIEITQSAVYVR